MPKHSDGRLGGLLHRHNRQFKCSRVTLDIEYRAVSSAAALALYLESQRHNILYYIRADLSDFARSTIYSAM